MLRLTDVTKNLLIINVLVYFGAMILLGQPTYPPQAFGDWGMYMLGIFYPASEFFRPYQIISHMFMHGSITHLFFNMFALFMFGPPLETLWGPKRFLFYYLFAGFGALGLQLLVQWIELSNGSVPQASVNIPMVGASGAIFGILAGFGMKFPNSVIQLIFPPIPMKAKYFVIIFAGLELVLGLSGRQSGIAHFAHVGGALFGLLLILYWNRFGSRLE